jgi:HTH-type transcriptional regulator, cell division transcriptional repressor
MSFGRNLQTLREAAGLSQSGLAKKAGIPVKSIQNWEIDRAQPRLDGLVKLAQALGAKLEELTDGVSTTAAKRKPRKKRPTG